MPQTHQGSCHCGLVKFEVDADIDHLRSCDCSVCRRRGALVFRVANAHFRLLTPWEAVRVYRWGTKTGADYFCSVCGILPFRRPSDLTPEEVRLGVEPFHGFAINARCLPELNLAGLPVREISGSTLEI